MMRPWLLMFLLFLSILLHDAQGIRFIRKDSSPAVGQHSIHEQVSGKRSNEGVEEGVIECRSKKCSGIRIRKLTMIHISTSTTIEKNDKNEEIKDHTKLEALSSTNQTIGSRKEENLSVHSSPEPYPDTLDDIAEMDYSLQARRKPPIHN